MEWAPTEEDYLDKSESRRRGFRGGERSMSRLVEKLIPEDSKVYAGIDLFLDEDSRMIQELQTRGFLFDVTLKTRSSSLWRLIRHKALTHEVVDLILAEVDKKLAVDFFEHY